VNEETRISFCEDVEFISNWLLQGDNNSASDETYSDTCIVFDSDSEWNDNIQGSDKGDCLLMCIVDIRND